jgi:site-specific recombinase XerD
MSQTTPESVERFFQALSDQRAAELTIRNYRSDLVHFVRWFEGSTAEPFSPAAITLADIREYRSHLLNIERRAPATIQRRLTALRKFCQWALAQQQLTDDPTRGVKGVAAVPRAPRWLGKQDLDKLLRAGERSGNKRDLAILATLCHTGLRVSEVCALRVDSVQLSERKGQLEVWGNGTKQRVVPLNLDLRKALAAYLEVRPKLDSPHLFLGQRGNGLTAKGVADIVRKYAYQAGLQEVSPHTLRHSFGKHAVEAGVDLVTVATRLGHQRLETAAIYTTPRGTDLEQAVRKLERDQREVTAAPDRAR